MMKRKTTQIKIEPAPQQHSSEIPNSTKLAPVYHKQAHSHIWQTNQNNNKSNQIEHNCYHQQKCEPYQNQLNPEQSEKPRNEGRIRDLCEVHVEEHRLLPIGDLDAVLLHPTGHIDGHRRRRRLRRHNSYHILHRPSISEKDGLGGWKFGS